MEVKQVILYRRDLGMRKGKIAAQVAHASTKVFFDRKLPTEESRLVIPLDDEMSQWVNGLFAKIVLSVETEEDLLRAYEEAKNRGIPCSLIQDAGRTEFKQPCPNCNVQCDVHYHLEPDGRCSCGKPNKSCVSCEGRGMPKPTFTTVALGPAYADKIDAITGPTGLVKTKLA